MNRFLLTDTWPARNRKASPTGPNIRRSIERPAELVKD